MSEFMRVDIYVSLSMRSYLAHLWTSFNKALSDSIRKKKYYIQGHSSLHLWTRLVETRVSISPGALWQSHDLKVWQRLASLAEETVVNERRGCSIWFVYLHSHRMHMNAPIWVEMIYYIDLYWSLCFWHLLTPTFLNPCISFPDNFLSAKVWSRSHMGTSGTLVDLAEWGLAAAAGCAVHSFWTTTELQRRTIMH